MSLVATKNESLRRSAGWLYFCPSGDVAQLGERGVRNAEVEGSIPFVSTKIPAGFRGPRPPLPGGLFHRKSHIKSFFEAPRCTLSFLHPNTPYKVLGTFDRVANPLL